MSAEDTREVQWAKITGGSGPPSDVVAMNATHEQIIAGEAVTTPVRLDPKDPVVTRILAASFEAHDTCMALGQRLLALEAEIHALRGAAPQPAAAPNKFRPSHYSQIEPVSGDDLRQQIVRWLEGR